MRTIIGLFDEGQEAQRAVAALQTSGFTNVTSTRDDDSPNAQEVMSRASIPAQDRQFYTEGVRQGGTLVIVQTDDNRSREAAALLTTFNMVDVDTRMAQYTKQGKADMALTQLDDDGTVIPIVEEEIQVGKRQVQRGGVRIHTTVTERPVEEQVTLREEHVHVERRPVERTATEADFTTFQEGSFELTETAEEAVVSKQARVIEEVVVGKESSEHTETIRDSVRRTDVDVEQIAGQTKTSGTTTSFASYDSDFKNYFDTTLKDSGYTYEQYNPVFKYGYGLAGDDRYRNKQWNAIEKTARSDWEAKNPGTWEQFKDGVRYAWQQATGKRS